MDEINKTRPGGLPEEGATNAAAAASAAGVWGGESDREAVDEAIYDFAASFDADDDEGVAMGGYDVDDGVAGGGEGKQEE